MDLTKEIICAILSYDFKSSFLVLSFIYISIKLVVIYLITIHNLSVAVDLTGRCDILKCPYYISL